MLVEIDAREQRRGESASLFFKKQNCRVHTRQLPVGDFIFDRKAVFEFKTASDFIQSIFQKRIFKQCKKMMQYPFACVVVQGDVYRTSRDLIRNNVVFSKKIVLGAFATILDMNVYVIQVETEEGAFDFMLRSARVFIENNESVKAIDRPITKMTNPAATFLACIQDIGLLRATLIANRLNIESLEDLMKLSKEELVSVDGVGEKTANKILEVLK